MPPLTKATRCFKLFASAGSALERALGLVAVAVVMLASLSECLACHSGDPMLHVGSGRGLQRLELRTAQPRTRLDAAATAARQPLAPVLPPAPGIFRGCREPFV